MIPGILFASWRITEIVTLIPIVGMLSWFVDGFNKNNQLTPIFILVLFIVSVLALAWAFFTLILYHRARTSGRFVAFVDLLFVGALIAAVYELRGITNASCTNFSTSQNDIYLNLGPFGYLGGQARNPLALHVNKTCAMLKACFALAIMNIIFFFVTFVSTYSATCLSKSHSNMTNSCSHSGSAITTVSNTTSHAAVNASSTRHENAAPHTDRDAQPHLGTVTSRTEVAAGDNQSIDRNLREKGAERAGLFILVAYWKAFGKDYILAVSLDVLGLVQGPPGGMARGS
jgi:hypothetical protein